VGEGVKTLGDRPEIVEWDPYILWSEDSCSTFGSDPEEVRRVAEADLETQTSHKIEAILWTNTVDGADFGGSHPNISLSDASTTIVQPNGFTPVPIVHGFKDMILALGQALGGARWMIHVEKRFLPFLAYYGVTIQNGGRLVTTLGDHIVVAGTGYTGSDPVGNAASENYSWIYGTSMVEVLLSPIEVYSDVSQSIDRAANDIEYRAERMALAHWDHAAHIGLPICLEDPAVDCIDIGS
jgi:hypothetical protein